MATDRLSEAIHHLRDGMLLRDEAGLTSGVPKKSRNWGQTPVKLMGGLRGCRTDLTAQPVLTPADSPRSTAHPERLGEKGWRRTCEP